VLREAELFVMAQDVLVEVVGRIRAEHRHLVLPPIVGDEEQTALPGYVDRLARANAWVPDVLAGRSPDEVGRDKYDGDLLGEDRAAGFAALAAAACTAAREPADADAAVQAPEGDSTAGAYLELLAIRAAFAAHDIAMHLGSRACPLTEELARGLWERTAPDVERWRERGVFGPQFEPMPPDVSWRDRFLNTAGRNPHALEH
jgi:hypothetical protein